MVGIVCVCISQCTVFSCVFAGGCTVSTAAVHAKPIVRTVIKAVNRAGVVVTEGCEGVGLDRTANRTGVLVISVLFASCSLRAVGGSRIYMAGSRRIGVNRKERLRIRQIHSENRYIIIVCAVLIVCTAGRKSRHVCFCSIVLRYEKIPRSIGVALLTGSDNRLGSRDSSFKVNIGRRNLCGRICICLRCA